MHQYSVLILENHIDTLGHVNNATYFALYEQARWDLITSNGYGLKEVQERRQGPVILEIQVKFMKELRLRERITITTELLKYEGKVGELRQKMLKENGETASEAIFVFAFFDLAERKLILPTEAWKKAVGLKP